MKKKVIGIFVCIMLMAVIPASAGLNCNTEPEVETKGLVKERILMRGVIVNPHTTVGGKFAFFGIRVHYTVIGTQGFRYGTLNMQRITLPEIPNGIVKNGYMLISLRGHIDGII
jgi:hypothetical protein